MPVVAGRRPSGEAPTLQSPARRPPACPRHPPRVQAPRPKPSRLYTAAEEAAVDARIESAEAALLSERRRRRALRHVKALLEKRLPEAEAAAAALADVADQFAASGGE